MKKLATFLTVMAIAQYTHAQGPEVTSWLINTTGATYNGILTDVESVYYTNTNVYVKSSGIPYYYQDGLSVNDGADGATTFNIPRNPVENTGTKTAVGRGPIGLYIDGSTFFNAADAMSYQNAGKWNQCAYYFEKSDFDPTNGHSTPTHTYHHHVIDLALCSATDSSKHSPLTGYAFDGFPLYGPYGYNDPMDTTSHITRIQSSYHKRNITQRTTLPDGTAATGPAISSTYPLGCYMEDFEYIASSGHLDQYNGRFCKTPEYPNGTYAYFKTIEEDYTPAFPYFIGPSYYGVVQSGNTGPGGGKNTVPSTATKYTPPTSIKETAEALELKLYPNPVSSVLYIEMKVHTAYNVAVIDMNGNTIMNMPLAGNTLDMQQLATGMYMVILKETETGAASFSRVVKQ